MERENSERGMLYQDWWEEGDYEGVGGGEEVGKKEWKKMGYRCSARYSKFRTRCVLRKFPESRRKDRREKRCKKGGGH